MKGTLLIVDDEQEILDILPKYFSQIEYDCDAAGSVDAAKSLLKENDYDVVITDKNMPASDNGAEGGLELIRYIKEFDPSIVVIIMTGYASLESTISAMKLGAFDYIVKPFDLADLAALVDRIREYQNFLNPEIILDIYHLLHNEILDLLAKCDIPQWEQKQEQLRMIDEKFDSVFSTFKSWERIIVNQRERLAKISAYAEQLIESEPVTAETAGLAQHILNEAGKRL